MSKPTIYEAAYNGDYDFVKSKVDKNVELIKQEDEVSF